MAKSIGVRFRHAGKAYYFDPSGFDLKYNDAVIVETARGIEYGRVIMAPMNYADEKLKAPLKGVLRIATAEDTAREMSNREKEKEAFRICKEKILEHGLDMKLIATEYAFDDSKILFYFTADGRIDFRELVKDLAGIFRRRIELRQIGVRDETKILGGMGVCGRPLCCHTFLEEFAPVSIKMAKEQNLSLNPAKISGCCGRLMCCLRNEAETYADLKKGLPVKGEVAEIPDGRLGEVQSVNILRQLVKIVVDVDEDEKEIVEYPVSEIKVLSHGKKGRRKAEAAEAPELTKELEALTDEAEERREKGPVKGRSGDKTGEKAEEKDGEKKSRERRRDKNRDKSRDNSRDKGRSGREAQEDRENRDGRDAAGKDQAENVSREQKKFRQAVRKALENQQAEEAEREEARRARAEAANQASAGDEAPKKRRRRRHHKKKANPNESQETTG